MSADAPALGVPPTVVRELVDERAQASFPVRAMTHFLDGSRERTELREKFEKLIEGEALFDKTHIYTQTREVRYRNAMKKQRRIIEIAEELGLQTLEERTLLRQAVHDDLGTDLQGLMFIPNIQATFDEEQQSHWLPLAKSWEIVGCYAQTELGHGSNVRGLETTATFIPETDEFDIHSPTLTSTKWWPGALGRSANHAIVYARLIIAQKDYGVHSFMVPIRDIETHTPLAGVNVGDIGPKLGYNNQDNGFCRFDHVRIPRENMAMRQAQVMRTGKYTASSERKAASYSTMTYVRAKIVMGSGNDLSRAVTIAIRYSAVRRQGFVSRAHGSGVMPEEMTVLDYTMQQARLLPALASAYAFQVTGASMLSLLSSHDVSALHIASSGLKALCSGITCDMIETCRRACGGHGYLMASGLVEHLGTATQMPTVEGENYMIAQQTTRGLLKILAASIDANVQAPSGSLTSNDIDTAYIYDLRRTLSLRSAFNNVADLVQPEELCNAYRQRAAWSLEYVQRQLSEATANGMSSDIAWNKFCPDIVKASEAHCFYILVRNFYATVLVLKQQQSPLACVLRDLADLFALWWMQERLGEFFESGYLYTSTQGDIVRHGVRSCLDKVRPNAVALCDAWGHTDHKLNSALGRNDGRVYEALFAQAQSDVNPMNAHHVSIAFHESLKPMRRPKAKL